VSDRRAWLGEWCPYCWAAPGARCRQDRYSSRSRPSPGQRMHVARGWRERSCPSCKALAAGRCHTPSGREASQPHAARLRPGQGELAAREAVWEELERRGVTIAVVPFSGRAGGRGPRAPRLPFSVGARSCAPHAGLMVGITAVRGMAAPPALHRGMAPTALRGLAAAANADDAGNGGPAPQDDRTAKTQSQQAITGRRVSAEARHDLQSRKRTTSGRAGAKRSPQGDPPSRRSLATPAASVSRSVVANVASRKTRHSPGDVPSGTYPQALIHSALSCSPGQACSTAPRRHPRCRRRQLFGVERLAGGRRWR
jgi:hypothetical protein